MVSIDGVGPDPVDPLLDCTFTTLTPSLTHSDFSSTPDALNPNLNLHSHLQAMVLRSPGKLLKQVHTILDESTQQDKASFPESDNMIKNVFSKNDSNPREKRPALGLKRAKFSMKPMPSQPDVVPEPTIDISKLSDPVEFFAAYERMENAKKELQRLRGEPFTDLDQNLPTARQRRPSLFGKSATYKHRSYSSALPDNSEKLLSSQEKSEKHIQSPIREAPAENDVMNNYEHARLSDSTPAVTSESNELDELLSCDYGGLDEAGIVDLVQNKLQIKFIDIGQPTFPDLLDVPRRESETSCDSLSKMTETISRLNGVRNAAGSKRLPLSSQFTGASVHHQGQSRSPLASISLLNRRISKLSTLTDPFSALDDTGSLPVRTTPSPETLQPNQFDARDDLYESQLLEHVRETAEVANPSTLSEERITKSVERQEQPDGFGQCSQDCAREDLQEHVDSMVHGEETTAVASVTDVSSPETLQPNQFDARDDLYESQPLEHVREIAEVANPSTLSEERITTQSVERQEQPDGFGQYSQDGAREDLQEHMDSLVHGEETTAVASVTHVGDARPITGQDGSESGQDGAATDLGALRRSPGEHSVADVGDAPRISAAVGIDLTSENNEQRDETIQADPLRDAIQHEPNIELSAAEKSCSKEGEECGIDKTLTTEDIVAEEPNKEAAEHSKRKLEKGKRKLVKGKKSKVSSPGNASKGTAETGGEANPQPDVPDSVSETTGNRKRKAEGTQRMNKREQLRCRRNSLYEAGTKWEAGVRRSTRIRMRPLEFWKGERFLYGRVHNSLVTVIGVKYYSPSTQDDAPPDKVKAFVSDEYKELVDLAAYY